MHQGKLLVLSCYNHVYLIWLFIQLSIFLGNSLLRSKGIMPLIAKYWLLLRAFIITMGTFWVVLFIFKLTANHLFFSLVNPTLVENNSDGQSLSWTSFLVSTQFITKTKTMLFQMPFITYQQSLLPCLLFPLYAYCPSQPPKRQLFFGGSHPLSSAKT